MAAARDFPLWFMGAGIVWLSVLVSWPWLKLQLKKAFPALPKSIHERVHASRMHENGESRQEMPISNRPTTGDCPMNLQEGAPHESVEHPLHYGGDCPHEVIKCLAAWGLESDALLWNAVKYIARAGKKGGFLTDLRKAQFYLNRRIAEQEALNKEKTAPVSWGGGLATSGGPIPRHELDPK